MNSAEIIHDDCLNYLNNCSKGLFDLTFLDHPFNQGKEYKNHDDDLPSMVYWEWMEGICRKILEFSSDGAAIYFMQREKNTEQVLRVLRESGWVLQNLIIWRKMTSAVPGSIRFGKQYQIIAFATKGERPRVFHRLRIDPPIPPNYKSQRANGVYVTDIWDDVRELTSGYFAGDEALRTPDGTRLHKQQSPVHLLLRILLSSTNPGDVIFDPFAGTGTSLIVAKQLGRKSIGVESNEEFVSQITERTTSLRPSDDIKKFAEYYRYTPDIEGIWVGGFDVTNEDQKLAQLKFSAI